jgi:hypothetical protein
MNWKVSSFCETNGCVQVAFNGDHVYLRSTFEPDDMLKLSGAEWDDFVKAIIDGEFRR